MLVHQLNNLTFPILVNKEKKKKEISKQNIQSIFHPEDHFRISCRNNKLT